MNVNEYGVVFQMGVSFNMVSNTSLSFTFTKPNGTILTVSAVLGTLQITTPVGVFAPNTYATYTFANGDVNQVGTWSARLTYIDAAPTKLISTPATFVVSP